MKTSAADESINFLAEREAAILAPYAQHSVDSAGRRYPEPPHTYRGPYQRDRDRILHSAAFRRLSQKTQVFTGEMGDYHRTRLTHTLEVASIARTIARALRLNEDLVEALALAHDIGHPPFGHSGEDVLDECLREHGGFTHNAQALRICEVLETRYPRFPGLNLTSEVLEGQRARATKSASSSTNESPLLEVQVLDAADSIAYDAHDADDALEIGLLQLEELLAVPMWREASDRVSRRISNLNDRHLRRAIVHEVIDWQVSDVLTVAQQELASRQITSVAEARRAPILVHPSTELAEKKSGLEQFLFERVYRHPGILSKRLEAQAAVREMFQFLVGNAERLPAKFRRLAERDGVHRAAGDYLAGMTDRFAFVEYRRLSGQ
jgi:dGTPase